MREWLYSKHPEGLRLLKNPYTCSCLVMNGVGSLFHGERSKPYEL